MNNQLAIILVNYNGYLDTIECLKSISQSEYFNLKIFITDNASTDDSVLRLKEYILKSDLPIELIECKRNNGFSAGNNVALKEALKNNEIKYFLFLNNDTIVTKELFPNLILALDSADCSIGKIMYESNRNRIWYAGGTVDMRTLKPIHFGYNEVSNAYEKPLYVTFATGCCFCMTRECVEKVGLWDETYFLYEEDVDYSIRILKQRMKIKYNPKALLYHKVGTSTGKVSGMAEYYQIRNRLWLIKRYLHPMQKIYAYFYNACVFLNRVIKREYSLSPMIAGIKAFFKGETGKHEGFVN